MPHLSLKTIIANLNLGTPSPPQTRQASTPRLDLSETTVGPGDHVRVQGNFVKVSEGMHFVLDVNGGEVLVKITQKFPETLPPPEEEDAELPWFVFIEPGPNIAKLEAGNAFTLFIAGSLVLVEVIAILRRPEGLATPGEITMVQTWCVEGGNEVQPKVLGTPACKTSPLGPSPNENSREPAPVETLDLPTEIEAEVEISIEEPYMPTSVDPPMLRSRSEREGGKRTMKTVKDVGGPSPLGTSVLPLPNVNNTPRLRRHSTHKPSNEPAHLEPPTGVSLLMQVDRERKEDYFANRSTSVASDRRVQMTRFTEAHPDSPNTRCRRMSTSSCSSTKTQLYIYPSPERTPKFVRMPHTESVSNSRQRSPSRSFNRNDNYPHLPTPDQSPVGSTRKPLPDAPPSKSATRSVHNPVRQPESVGVKPIKSQQAGSHRRNISSPANPTPMLMSPRKGAEEIVDPPTKTELYDGITVTRTQQWVDTSAKRFERRAVPEHCCVCHSSRR